MKVTTQLTSSQFPITPSFKDVLKASGGSAAGYSAVSGWLTCPEKSRLTSLGVRQARSSDYEYEDMDALSFGTLCHYLRGMRLTLGQDAVEQALETWRPQLPNKAWLKAKLLFRVYETLFPLAVEQLEVVGVECEVISEIGKVHGNPILRTVRYDTVVRLRDVSGVVGKEVFSFEAKTMARAPGMYSLNAYKPQAMCQVAIWNSNPNLVAQFGPMRGVIWDCLVKTEAPNVERLGPDYIGKPHQQLALQYLRTAEDETVQFRLQTDPDGTVHYPRMLHACWGRWSPCEYIDGCHEGNWSNYNDRSGDTLKGSP